MPRRSARRHAVLVVSVLALAACGDDGDGASDPITLEDEGATDDGATDDGATDDGATDDTADDSGSDAGPGDDATGGEVDGTRAEPGTWPIGDAGTVTFSLANGELSLDDVSPAAGWTVTEEESDGDELEVDFERGEEQYDVQIELDDGQLRIDIDHDLDGVDPGTFELGDAGSVTVAIDGGSLVVEDVTIADGWQEATREEDDDEFELDLVRDDRRWDLEIELDDGRLDVQRDLEIRGPA